MASTAFQRKLDFAPTASIDKVALNNKVVSMRAAVRRAKLYTINALVKKIQKLRNKKGTESQQSNNKGKADRLTEEMKIIKMLKPDYVSKYALGSTERFEELAAKPSTTLDMRALARLGQNKFIHDEVVKFRAEHEDWQELAAFLMTKHTAREFKKKKTKEKMKKVEANVKASETLVHKFLGEKLKGNNDLHEDDPDENNDDASHEHGNEHDDKGDENDDSDDVNDDEEVDSSNSNENDEGNNSNFERIMAEKKQGNLGRKQENQTLKKQTLMKQKMKTRTAEIPEREVESESEGSNEEGIDSMKPAESDDESGEENELSDSNKNSEGDSDEYISMGSESASENDMDDNSEEGEEDSGHVSEDSPKKLDSSAHETSVAGHKAKEGKARRTATKEKISKSKSIEKGTNNTKEKKKPLTEKVQGAMIVKKLDLSKNADEDSIPEILRSKQDKQVKHKKKRKDAFFDAGDESDSGSHDNVEAEETHSDRHAGNDNEADVGDRTLFIQPTRASFSTCFVGSLRSNNMMACSDSRYRSNEDWKRMRQDARDQKMGRDGESMGSFSRGRGHGPPFRGRGFSSQFTPGRGRGHGFGQTGEFMQTDRREPDSGKGNRTVEKSLHPSWEARKKRKQQEKGLLQAFTGKKVKFDD